MPPCCCAAGCSAWLDGTWLPLLPAGPHADDWWPDMPEAGSGGVAGQPGIHVSVATKLRLKRSSSLNDSIVSEPASLHFSACSSSSWC